MNDIMEQIENHVKKEIKTLSSSQKNTLRALLYSGYKGEREAVLLDLLKNMGEYKISNNPLLESFQTAFENKTSEVYWRIKPEFYRAVRKKLFDKA